ncbi:pilus assembly FimT family protein [Acinetobacter indicus]|uniref:pilus assembly FimT family protein n=1 Tax=Acinetobacter indicus TaxID=756892 RepID=UPI001A8ED03E|nr:prepilin-type N-terminal cleavage/methylation domain-containing protein [Acinetobacter indicus]QSQ97200.1 prepilin-type N-terminal cleavage/methylation domain-containing protein [Acinetobacter indicus]
MRKSQGFTLIELMVTIAVLAIVAMIAVPSFGDLVAKRHLDTSIRELSLVLSDTRAQATTLRKNITVKFEEGSNTAETRYWVPRYNDVSLNSNANNVDFSDLVYTSVGIPKQRTKMIPNPHYDANQPTDLSTTPPTNPSTVEVLLPLKFELCHDELKQSRTITLSMNGTVEKIESGVCS